MKRIIILLLSLLFLAGCNEITVMSYNIHAMRGMDGVIDAERICDVIMAEKPDLVALQEVDQLTERSGYMDALAVMKERCDIDGIFMKTFDYQGGGFGNVILSRFPIIEQRVVDLPARENYEARLLMMVSCITDRGDTVHFYNTHLDHHSGDSDRPVQIAAIIDVVTSDNATVILAGDLNCQPGSEPLNALDKVLIRCVSEEKTYPADIPERIIDHIYYDSNSGLQCKSIYVVNKTVASDHRPIVAKFKMPR